MSYFDPPDNTPEEEALMEEQQRRQDIDTLVERIDAAIETDGVDHMRDLLREAAQRIYDLEQQRARTRSLMREALDFAKQEAEREERF